MTVIAHVLHVVPIDERPDIGDRLSSLAVARLTRLVSLAPFVALVLVKLWLVGGQRLTAYGSLTIDDQWFVARASAISDGEWLGPFDTYTLIKQPGYPMFVAGVYTLRLPLLLAQQLLYAVAAAAIVAVLRPVLPGRRSLVAFGLLLFNPVTMNTSISARVDRALVYASASMLLLACLVGLVVTSRRPDRRFAAWVVATATAFAAVWLLREEWVLTVPAVAVGVGAAAIRLARSPGSVPGRVAGTLGLVAGPLAVVATSFVLHEVNDARYGLPVNNISQGSVPHALGPMFRVEPVTAFAGYPVTRETRTVLYDVSPRFAGLRDELESGVAQRFATTRPDGVDDLGAPVFQWVVLDAIHATDQAATASRLDAMLRSIGSEIDTACDADLLTCGAPHTGIGPAWEWDRTPALAKRFVYTAWRTALLSPYDARSPAGDATGADRELFGRITREPLATGDDGVLTRGRAALIDANRWVYRALTLVALGVAAWRVVMTVVTRRRPDETMVALVVLGSLIAGARLVGLAYLDLTTFPALSPAYLAPAHAVAAAVLVAIAVARTPVTHRCESAASSAT